MVLVPAIFVVGARNLVHGVLWLGVTLLVTAAVYVRLEAPFVAAVQVLLYAGGVVILVIFGVMLTRRHETLGVIALRGNPIRGLLVAVPLFGTLVAAIVRTPSIVSGAGAQAVPVSAIGRALLTDYLFAFEVLSVLLLAGMIGAIVIARKKDPQPAVALEPVAGEVEPLKEAA
jgi:NADH-quinone oxidoreductase subunit J